MNKRTVTDDSDKHKFDGMSKEMQRRTEGKKVVTGDTNCLSRSVVIHACVHAKLLQSCPTLWPQPARLLCGILQARILELVVMPSSRGSSQYRNQTHILMSPALAGGFFTTSATWEAHLYQHCITKLFTWIPTGNRCYWSFNICPVWKDSHLIS